MSEKNNTVQQAKQAWSQSEKADVGSRILHTLGCLFIGSPSSLKMPSDFYYLQHDRVMPTPAGFNFEVAQRNIFVNAFRRILIRRLVKWILAFGVIAVLVHISGSFMISTISEKIQHHNAEKTNTQ